MQVHQFTFNEFAENTYVLFDSSGDCAIVDPGCNNNNERKQLDDFISGNGLKPTLLVNTHAHIDHVFGLHHVHTTYGIDLHLHPGEVSVLQFVPQIAHMYGLHVDSVNVPVMSIAEDQVLQFGETTLEILFTPGHSPASVCIFHRASSQLIAGDVLFAGSIGRTDLPGGDYDTLIASITDQILPLGDDVHIYPGHGPSTTVGRERARNPFLQGWR